MSSASNTLTGNRVVDAIMLVVFCLLFGITFSYDTYDLTGGGMNRRMTISFLASTAFYGSILWYLWPRVVIP